TLVMTAPVRPFTIMPWKLSLPLVTAAADAGAAQIVAAVPVASSATVSCRFMLPPQLTEPARASLPQRQVSTPHSAISGVRQSSSCRAGHLLSRPAASGSFRATPLPACSRASADRPFSGVADSQLSPVKQECLAAWGCASLSLPAHVAVNDCQAG